MSWLDNLLEAKAAKNVSNKWISEQSGVPKATVDRTFAGKNSPAIATLHPICAVLDTTLDEILNGTRTVISAHDVPELQETIDKLTIKLDELTIKLEALTVENDLLKEQVQHYKSENNILTVKLEFKDKLLEVHEHYMKK